MDAAIAELQRGFLTDAQIESSRAIMGVDTQLVDDGTYYFVEIDGQVAGCGGWSRRATRYGSDSTPGRDAHLLDPSVDPARVRAMCTDPGVARVGASNSSGGSRDLRVERAVDQLPREDVPLGDRRHRQASLLTDLVTSPA